MLGRRERDGNQPGRACRTTSPCCWRHRTLSRLGEQPTLTLGSLIGQFGRAATARERLFRGTEYAPRQRSPAVIDSLLAKERISSTRVVPSGQMPAFRNERQSAGITKTFEVHLGRLGGFEATPIPGFDLPVVRSAIASRLAESPFGFFSCRSGKQGIARLGHGTDCRAGIRHFGRVFSEAGAVVRLWSRDRRIVRRPIAMPVAPPTSNTATILGTRSQTIFPTLSTTCRKPRTFFRLPMPYSTSEEPLCPRNDNSRPTGKTHKNPPAPAPPRERRSAPKTRPATPSSPTKSSSPARTASSSSATPAATTASSNRSDTSKNP